MLKHTLCIFNEISLQALFHLCIVGYPTKCPNASQVTQYKGKDNLRSIHVIIQGCTLETLPLFMVQWYSDEVYTFCWFCQCSTLVAHKHSINYTVL